MSCFCLRIGNRHGAFCMFSDLPVFMFLSNPKALCFSLDVAHVDYGCVLRWMILFCVSFCFICYMFCAVFLWSLLSRGLGGLWEGGVFCKHVVDRTLARHMFCAVLLWSLLSRVFGGGILQTCL